MLIFEHIQRKLHKTFKFPNQMIKVSYNPSLIYKYEAGNRIEGSIESAKIDETLFDSSVKRIHDVVSDEEYYGILDSSSNPCEDLLYLAVQNITGVVSQCFLVPNLHFNCCDTKEKLYNLEFLLLEPKYNKDDTSYDCNLTATKLSADYILSLAEDARYYEDIDLSKVLATAPFFMSDVLKCSNNIFTIGYQNPSWTFTIEPDGNIVTFNIETYNLFVSFYELFQGYLKGGIKT